MTSIAPDYIAPVTLAVGTGIAAAVDVRHGRIPNVLTFSLAAAGIALALSGVSAVSARSGALGVGAGLALMLPGYALGGTGAGDVKLFAAAGALLGIERVLAAFLWVALAGGVLALAVSWRRRRLGPTLTRLTGLCAARPDVRTSVMADGGNRFCYGPAIAIGCVIAACG